MPIYAALTASYLLGSVPSALIAGKVLLGIDIRTVGSGNAGATNLYRVAGLKPYIAVLSADILKGFAAARFMASTVPAEDIDPLYAAILCGLAAVFGHIFTIFAGFKGGKGVATAAGMMLALVPGPLLIGGLVYFVILYFTSYVSLGSIGAAVSVPATLAVSHLIFGAEVRAEIYLIAAVMAALILVTHRDNIARLLKGEERKTEFFRRKDAM